MATLMTNLTSIPTLFYDPTSEPSRAVHWLCVEANISFQLKTIWLTNDDHLSSEYLTINPQHQVPALQHGDFCLSEATAIMQYLTDLNNCTPDWFGHDIKQRALINKQLSWYHTNLRQKLTLDYFLPVLLMPAYIGASPPSAEKVRRKLAALKGMFKQLNGMLAATPFLAGTKISVADLLFAADIFALKIDPQYNEIIEVYPQVNKWLNLLQQLPSYTESHNIWDKVTPLITAAAKKPKTNLSWVAEACSQT